MSFETEPHVDLVTLRARAVSQLEGPGSTSPVNASMAGALKVLYDLAGAPATAGQAMALLHELQVQQVELDMQTEELQRTHHEMQMLLARHIQL